MILDISKVTGNRPVYTDRSFIINDQNLATSSICVKIDGKKKKNSKAQWRLSSPTWEAEALFLTLSSFRPKKRYKQSSCKGENFDKFALFVIAKSRIRKLLRNHLLAYPKKKKNHLLGKGAHEIKWIFLVFHFNDLEDVLYHMEGSKHCSIP